MPVISVVNTKGGVGKTTTAMMLAWSLATCEHLDVEVRDIDPSSSALLWDEQVTAGGGTLPFAVTASHASMLHRRGIHDFVIVDTAPSNKADLVSAVEVSDFLVVPTKPGRAELERTLETVRYLDPMRTAVLLTQTERTITTTSAREALTKKVSLFDTEIPKREAVRRLYGQVPDKDYGYESVAKELLQELSSKPN